MDNDTAAGGRSRLLTGLGVGALALEATALVLAAGGYAVYAIAGEADSRGRSVQLAVFAAVLGLAVAAAAWGFARGRRWSHGLAVTWQILQLAVAATVFGASPAAGLALVALAAAVLVAVIARARVSGAARPSTD